ncbi:hypothetical protein QQ054_32655 [Oscillatoria amoena NRMC-F 0135]|nr:hypothetical protein [Oscillatoria amoena NRMC-F 0135]
MFSVDPHDESGWKRIMYGAGDFGAGDIFEAPSGDGFHDGAEGQAARGQRVTEPASVLLDGFLFHEAGFHEALQPVGENIRRDAFGGIDELVVELGSPEKITNHEQGPFVTENVEGTGDSARGTAFFLVSWADITCK